MIRYKSDLFGLRTLFMVSGSATSRAVVPAMVSTMVAWIYWEYARHELEVIVQDSYAISVMIGFFGFLLTTRLNFSYQRWWEATSMCHLSTSKLVDSAVCLAAFHHQTHLWDQPTSYGNHAAFSDTPVQDMELIDFLNLDTMAGKTPHRHKPLVRGEESDSTTSIANKEGGGGIVRWMRQKLLNTSSPDQNLQRPDNFVARGRTWSISNLLVTKSFTPNRRQFTHGHMVPQSSISDFLEEMVHLYSLLNAVSMASLRHDIEGCPSPLSEYQENEPLPPYNSEHYRPLDEHDDDDDSLKKKYCRPWYDQMCNQFYFLIGWDSSPKQRTIYNAGRPFSVLGGVSEAEATRLQLARGPMAQVALCQLWLKEFIVREHLHGSTGDVGDPFITRVINCLSEGTAAYHQCRNVAYVPFPFVHEQLTRFFTFVVVFTFPCLYVAFVNTKFMALLMNFVTLLCFQGIYEVARELSNPYHTVPNDLPLNLFHSQFNESLRTLLMGFHPDSKTKEA